MQGPALLPQHLLKYESVKTEQELAEALIKVPGDLIDFFEVAVADETWSEEHKLFLRTALRWSAKAFFMNQLSKAEAFRIVKSIQEHYSILKPLLFFRPALYFTITLQVENQPIVINSLMFATYSPFFFNNFKVNCYAEMTNEWEWSVSLPIFRIIEEHISKGEVAELWRLEYALLLEVMQKAKEFQIHSLVEECASILKRYINQFNVIETLLKAHKQRFVEWKKDCIDVFNQQGWGLRVLSGRDDDLRVEVLDYKQETIDLFDQLAPSITHLAFRGQLAEDPYYGVLIDSCPRLIGADLSGSAGYSEQFDELPVNLKELDISACSWLKPEHIREANIQFPYLKELDVSSNPQLNYLSWGELNRFKQLITLKLSRCSSLTDEDLKLISQASPHLREIEIEECRNITDIGVINLIHNCIHVTRLNLSRCLNLTDKALAEIGKRASYLTHLELIRCTGLSDRGLIQLIQNSRALVYLNVSQCEFSLKTVEKIRYSYPLLQIED